MDQYGTLSIRMRIAAGGHSRFVTVYRASGITRSDCEETLIVFFEDNPHIHRRECAIEWVYKDYL